MALLQRQVINIGSGVDTTITQLVDTIEQVCGKRVNRLRNGEKSGGIHRLTADISLAQRYLEYKPKVSLAEGLQKVLEQDNRFQTRVAHRPVTHLAPAAPTI